MQVTSLTLPSYSQKGGKQKTLKMLETFKDPNLVRLWEEEGSPVVKVKDNHSRPSFGIITKKIKLGKITQSDLEYIDQFILETKQKISQDPNPELQKALEEAEHIRDSYDQTLKNGHAFNREDFLSELSHGSQLKGKSLVNRVGKYLRALKEKSVLGENVYTTPGTLEHEAHSEIEPKLKSKYENAGVTALHSHKKGKKFRILKDSRGMGNDQLITRYAQLTAR